MILEKVIPQDLVEDFRQRGLTWICPRVAAAIALNPGLLRVNDMIEWVWPDVFKEPEWPNQQIRLAMSRIREKSQCTGVFIPTFYGKGHFQRQGFTIIIKSRMLAAAPVALPHPAFITQEATA
jgi:hypothetical protein